MIIFMMRLRVEQVEVEMVADVNNYFLSKSYQRKPELQLQLVLISQFTDRQIQTQAIKHCPLCTLTHTLCSLINRISASFLATNLIRALFKFFMLVFNAEKPHVYSYIIYSYRH